MAVGPLTESRIPHRIAVGNAAERREGRFGQTPSRVVYLPNDPPPSPRTLAGWVRRNCEQLYKEARA